MRKANFVGFFNDCWKTPCKHFSNFGGNIGGANKYLIIGKFACSDLI